MRYLAYGVILGSTLFSQGSFAAQQPLKVSAELQMLFDQCKLAKNAQAVPGILEDFKSKNLPEVVKQVCVDIKDPSFYKAAEEAGVGIIKNRAMVTWCEGVEFERADVRKVVQKEKGANAPREMPKLKHVDLTAKAKTVEAEEVELKAAQEVVKENAERLGKMAEYQARLQKVTEDLKIAQDHYGNLIVAVMGMREDLKEPAVARNLKVFNPHAHADDSPEAYVMAAEVQLAREDPSQSQDATFRRTFPGFMGNLHIASGLLRQARENQERARADLVAINEEMMRFTH